eukprot:12273648-Karenia_brevis.AAC.1
MSWPLHPPWSLLSCIRRFQPMQRLMQWRALATTVRLRWPLIAASGQRSRRWPAPNTLPAVVAGISTMCGRYQPRPCAVIVDKARRQGSWCQLP